VVVFRIDVGEIEHLLEVPSDGADETQLNALSWHESHFPEGKGEGRTAGSGQLAAGSERKAPSAGRSAPGKVNKAVRKGEQRAVM